MKVEDIRLPLLYEADTVRLGIYMRDGMKMDSDRWLDT
jgi:hypothetical protein